MDYVYFHTHVADGDVLLFQGTAAFSRLIRCVTRSRYSHVGLACWLTKGERSRLCVIEALEPYGVRVYPMARYLAESNRHGVVVDWYRVTDWSIDRRQVVQYALDQWGARYVSPWQLALSFGRLTRWVRGLLGQDNSRNADHDRFFCSELVLDAFERGGFASELAPVLESPGDIATLPFLSFQGSLDPIGFDA
jgi:hypothetical protein